MTNTPPVAPPYDPEIAATLATLPRFVLTTENLPFLREAMANGIPGMEGTDLTAGGAVRLDEFAVPASGSRPEVALLMLRPAHGEGPWPVIYNTHGGGMVAGNRYMEAPAFLQFVADGTAALVAVEYRLAPEHPDPAPIEDCYAGLVWVADNASKLSLDPDRILIAGMSAGGGLAAGTALLARDRGYPHLTHQIMVSPMLDDRFSTHSSQMQHPADLPDGIAPILSELHENLLFDWNALLGDRRGGSDVSIYAAPARAEDLSNLPSTYIDVGDVETFRDEAIAYASRLSNAGIPVDFHLWAGGGHGFDITAPHAAVSQAARWVRDDFIRRALRT